MSSKQAKCHHTLLALSPVTGMGQRARVKAKDACHSINSIRWGKKEEGGRKGNPLLQSQAQVMYSRNDCYPSCDIIKDARII